MHEFFCEGVLRWSFFCTYLLSFSVFCSCIKYFLCTGRNICIIVNCVAIFQNIHTYCIKYYLYSIIIKIMIFCMIVFKSLRIAFCFFKKHKHWFSL